MSKKSNTPEQAPPRIPVILGAIDPSVRIYIPHLAAEIGLNESLVLVQLAYLIRTTPHEREGRLWTYQSIDDLRARHFPFWSRDTIDRTLKRLADGYTIRGRKVDGLGLLTIRDDFNKRAYDRTRWFALNLEAIDATKTATIGYIEPTPEALKSLSDNRTGSSDNQTGSSDSRTTIPKNLSKTPSNINPKDSIYPLEGFLDDDESTRSDSSSSPSDNGKKSKSKSKKAKPKNPLKSNNGDKPQDADPIYNAVKYLCPPSSSDESKDGKVGRLEATAIIKRERLGGSQRIEQAALIEWPKSRPSNAGVPSPWPGQLVDTLRHMRDRERRTRSFLAEPIPCADCDTPTYAEDSTCPNCGRVLDPIEAV